MTFTFTVTCTVDIAKESQDLEGYQELNKNKVVSIWTIDVNSLSAPIQHEYLSLIKSFSKHFSFSQP